MLALDADIRSPSTSITTDGARSILWRLTDAVVAVGLVGIVLLRLLALANSDADSQPLTITSKVRYDLLSELDDLRATRSELESTHRQIETQTESITSLKQERSNLEADLADLPETPMGDHQHLETETEQLRETRQTLSSQISDLQSLIQYNEERLAEEDYEVLEALDVAEQSESNGSPTDELLADGDDDITYWTCGTVVEHDQIEATVERLRERRQDLMQELNEVKSDLEELKTTQREAKKQQNRREVIERNLADIETELESREDH